MDLLLRPRNAGAAMIERGKIRCMSCGWAGTLTDPDKVPDPRPLEGTIPNIWFVCPECRAPDHFYFVCDEPGCKHHVKCGTPTPEGYRSTCYRHAPQVWRAGYQ